MNLPNSLQTLTFGERFNRSLEGVNLPNSLQTLTFGSGFNQSLEGMTLPTALDSSVCHGVFRQQDVIRLVPR